MAVDLTPLPPRDAIAALARRGKTIDPTFSWLDRWQEDHAHAFTVAKSAGFDILNDIYQELLKALAEGKTFRDFAAELTPVLQKKGWWGRQPAYDPETDEMRWSQLGSTRRLRTIFDANMRVSYAAGHWASFERNKPARPFLRYVHVDPQLHDSDSRKHHARQHNVVLPVDHPHWNTWATPNGWGCRCTLQSLSQRDIDRLQAEGEELKFEPPADTWRSFINRRTGEVSRVPDGIDPGWAYNPGKAGYNETRRAAEAKMADGLFGAPLPRQWPPPPRNPAEIERLADELSSGQAAWEEALTSEEEEAIATYKSVGYRSANAVLRDDQSVLEDYEEDDIEAANLLIADLSDALRRARLPKSITTFRGIPFEIADRFEGLQPGDTVADPAFFSSSLSQRTAESFGEFVIEARLQEGAPAIAFIHFIPGLDHVEYEVLLDAGTRMRVVEARSDRLIVEILRPK